jgi:voltage-gated potassium channel
MSPERPTEKRAVWRDVLHEVIFHADTPVGKLFDVLLIVCILLSVLVVMLDSVGLVRVEFGRVLYWAEWVFTILFSVEYVLRLICAIRPLGYTTSFFGVVDLLSIAPTYLSLIFPVSKYLLVIRVLRILRVFRVLKLMSYIGAADLLLRALGASRRKITVFLFTVLTMVVVFGSIMYVIEGEENGFTSIPRSIYWAIVTMTTVGYGDISPKTPVGQALASVIMIMGYGIIAVPTGIVTVELTQAAQLRRNVACVCSALGHQQDAVYCRRCGVELPPPEDPPEDDASSGGGVDGTGGGGAGPAEGGGSRPAG